MCCGQTTCCKPNKCCGQEECCSANQICCGNLCETTECSLTLDPDEVCPGGSVELPGVAICNPECVTMSLTAVVVEAAWQGLVTVNVSPGSVPCGPFKTPFTVTVSVSPDAIPGTFTVRVTGKIIDGGEVACETTADATVTVRSVDLVFDGLPEEEEEDPGGLICVNNDDDDMSARADKDDDPGPIVGENDLKTLELKLNGLDPGGMGTLDVLQGDGGIVRVYFNPDRSGPVALPFTFSGADLPITLFVEGYQASTAARDVSIEMIYILPTGEICKDKVNVSVGGVEFEGTEFTRDVHRNMDLIHLINPSPLVQLDEDSLPSTGAPVVFPIDGEVTNRIAPLTNQDITINDQPVQSLILVDSGETGLGPFKQRFSRNVTLPDHDLLLKAKAVDALGNSGWDKKVAIADFDCNPPLGCPGTFLSRSTREEPFTPTSVGDTERFSIAVVDPFATGDMVTVQIDTGVEQRALQVPRVTGTIRFEQEYLYLVPENLNLPPGTPQAVVDTRLKGKLGKPVRATYTVCNKVRCDDCEDNALTVGIMFVAASTGQPVDVALAGLPKDVADGGINRQPLKMIAGVPGDASIVTQDGGAFKVDANLTARDYRDDVSTAGNPTGIELSRVSDDPMSPDFNLFQSDPASPLLPLASDTTAITSNPQNLTLHDVHSGGFLRLEVEGKEFFGAPQAVEPVRGPIVVNVLVDGLGAGFPQASFAPAVPPNFQTLLESGSLPSFAKLVGDTAHSIRRYDGLTTFPSITYSAWSSWVTGKDPGLHGVTGSNFYRRDPAMDPFWGGNSEMKIPIDHVNFLGTQPIQDLDVRNVWATLGTLNSSIRPEVPTIYEALLPDGFSSFVVYHFPFRGTFNTTGLPTPYEGFWDHWNDAGAGLDDGTAAELIELMDSANPLRPPQVLTVYYASLDHNVHHDPNYPASGAGFLTTTDRYVGTLVRILEQWNLMDEAMFTFTGDHGLTDVYNDDKHSILIETTFYLELEAVFEEAGYDVLDNADPIVEGDYDSVVTLNGGMAHIYVRDRTTNLWPNPPNYGQDVLPLAERFYDNAVGLVADLDPPSPTQLNGAIELVLVRDAAGGNWSAPYRVLYRANVTSGSFTTVPIGDALSITFPDTGLPLVPSRYVDPVTNLQRLQDKRSGDIILLSNYSKKHRNAIAPAEEGDPNGLDGGYYFGSELPCCHGSLYDTDMTIPIVFGFPRGSGASLDAFLTTVGATLPVPPGQPEITDIARTIYRLETGVNLP
jgi:hypothetical protein